MSDGLGYSGGGSGQGIGSPGAAYDAFGRQRVSNPLTIFDSKLVSADKQALFWDEGLESGGGIAASAPTAAKPYIDITSTDVTAGVFTRQTRRRLVYQPGKSQLILMTGVLSIANGGVGAEHRIGYFDDNNGLFFEQHAGVVGVTVRSNDSGSPVDTTVPQASWNLDPMNGSGRTGVTVDWSTSQIFVIDFQWLAVGRVRFGLEIGGKLYYIHEHLNANLSPTPYMSTPNLPLRYQLITTADSGVSTLRVICSAVISEGGLDPPALTRAHATTDHVNANTADTFYALIGVRLQAAKLGCDIAFGLLSVLSETNDQFEWALFFNPTVAGGGLSYSDLSNSCVQVAVGDGAGNPSVTTVTNGTIVARGFGAAQSSESTPLQSALKPGAALDGTLDEFVLAARPLGANADLQGSLGWREIA